MCLLENREGIETQAGWLLQADTGKVLSCRWQGLVHPAFLLGWRTSARIRSDTIFGMPSDEQTETDAPSLSGVLGGGIGLTWAFVKRRPWSFVLAVSGAILFVSAIVASAVVVGRVTDDLIIPVLQGGESIDGKLRQAVLLIVGVSVWKSVGITMRRGGCRMAPIRGRALTPGRAFSGIR